MYWILNKKLKICWEVAWFSNKIFLKNGKNAPKMRFPLVFIYNFYKNIDIWSFWANFGGRLRDISVGPT